MTTAEQAKQARLGSLVEFKVEPTMELLRQLISSDSVERVHTAQTLLELLSWLLLGIEIGYFPRVESSATVQTIFQALGDDFQELMSSYAESWDGNERARFFLAFHQSHSTYPGIFPRESDEVIEALFATSLVLSESFMQDKLAQIYIMAQNHYPAPAWSALKVRSATLTWAGDCETATSEPPEPPFWVPGFLGAFDHIDGQLSLFRDRASPGTRELKSRIIGLQGWRFNIRNKDVAVRFFEVADSIAEILDLITPAQLDHALKAQFRGQVRAVAEELFTDGHVVIGAGA
jgi:hypothetical protein